MTNDSPIDRNRPARPTPPEPQPRPRPGRERESIGEAAVKSMLRSVAASLGRAIVRAITGSRR